MAAMTSVTRRSRSTPRAKLRSEVERRLLEAAERLVADGQSFTELSVEQLSSEAGIARSTFYVYFEDKSELVIRLGMAMLEEVAEVAGAWWDAGPRATRADLHAATLGVVRLYAEHATLFAALTETAAFDERIRRIQVEALERYSRPLRELIEAAKAEGSARDVHPAETVAAITWMVEGSCYHLARGASEDQLERLAQTLTSIVWHSLYPDDADGAET